MATTIKLKNSVTTTNAPSSLAQGELAINITDKKVWVGNAATTPIQLLGDGGSVQFTTVDTTNLQVTNIKAKDGTASASIANSTGIFTHATATAFTAGTVSAPALTTTGDTNTGIFFPAADTIAFTEGGAEAMRIDNSGRVGIGTTTPATPLQVNGTITATSLNTDNTFGFKNRIINGAMVIDQRNAGASVTPTSSATGYATDRWALNVSQNSKFTAQQSSAFVGFSNSLLITSSSAYSVASGDYFMVDQNIEGFNVADLGWGTANAQTVTLSFKVKSSLTGTFGGVISNSANNRSYPFSYTISTANTETSISITIAGDTSGTWLTTNGVGIRVRFSMGVGTTYQGTAGAWAGATYLTATGAVSVVGTNGATFYITGVQLEVGSTATSFDYRPYGTELALCQRYYEKSFQIATAPAQNAGTTGAFGSIQVVGSNAQQVACGTTFFKVPKRATPTITLFNPSAANANPRNTQRAQDWGTGVASVNISENNIIFNNYTTSANGVAGDDFVVHWVAAIEL